MVSTLNDYLTRRRKTSDVNDLSHGSEPFHKWPFNVQRALTCSDGQNDRWTKLPTELSLCIGVMLDSALTFALHARRPSGKSFYHLRQMNTVRKSLTEDAATTIVHAFVTSRVVYCNSVLQRVSAANVQPLQNLLNAAARIILRKRKFDHITTDVVELTPIVSS